MMRALLLTLLLGLPAQAKPNANELCNQADGLLARHEIKAGIDKYFQAIEQDKKCARAYAALGHVYYEASSGGAEPDRLSNFAIQLLDKAILLNPKDDKSLFYRGDLYVNQQQFAKALKDLNRSLAIRPGSMAYISRAVCYRGLKRNQKALEDYTKFYDLTHDATALYGRGNCYLELGQAEMALADYETVVAKSGSPKTVDSAKKQIASLHRQFGTMKTSVSTVKRAQQLYEKGRELKNSGHARESLKLFDQALAVDPTFARAAIMKGDAYFLLNDLDHAIQYYRRGLTLDPEDKQGHRFLGDVLERKFQQTKDRRLLEDALRHYEAALRIDPTYGLAQECAEQARMRLKKLPK